MNKTMESRNQVIETEGVKQGNLLLEDISVINANMDDNNANNKNGDSSKSNRSATRTRKKSPRQPYYMSESEEISISDLDLIANKRKLNKRSTEMSVGDIFSKKNEEASVSPKDVSSGGDKENTRKTKKTQKTLSTLSNEHKQYKDKHSDKHSDKGSRDENDDEEVRREKSELLYKFEKLNANKKLSSLTFTMNSRLRDIKNEYERVRNQLQTERSVKFFQRMLLLGVQGVEILNTKFDPLGVDLDGWGESMAYSLENQDYDEVLQELYEKYKGKGQMAPETKLIFMIISSASMFAITKKLTKSDSGLGALLGSFAGKSSSAPAPSAPAPVQPQYNAPQYNAPQYNAPQYNAPQYNAPQVRIPFASQLNNQQAPQQVQIDTDTMTDDEPSKLKGPDEDISIQNILQKMEQKRREQEQLAQRQQPQSDNETENTSEVLKSIPINGPKRRGRPPKNKKGVSLAR
jgi:hypothetical protein